MTQAAANGAVAAAKRMWEDAARDHLRALAEAGGAWDTDGGGWDDIHSAGYDDKTQTLTLVFPSSWQPAYVQVFGIGAALTALRQAGYPDVMVVPQQQEELA